MIDFLCIFIFCLCFYHGLMGNTRLNNTHSCPNSLASVAKYLVQPSVRHPNKKLYASSSYGGKKQRISIILTYYEKCYVVEIFPPAWH